MEIKTYIDKIFDTANEDKRAEMTDYVKHLLRLLPDEDRASAECKLYEMAEGKFLNEEKAKHLIEKMKPVGMKWDLAATEEIRNNYKYEDIRPIDFWVVMNSVYNDYNDIFTDNVDYYAKFSRDFIKDEDAVDNKVYYYFTMIPKKD